MFGHFFGVSKRVPSIQSVLDDTFQLIDRYSKRQITGIASGFKYLDELTSGFQKKNLIVLGGRPGMGKTVLALKMMNHAAIQLKYRVAYFSLETSNADLGLRLLCAQAKVNAPLLRANRPRPNDSSKLIDASKSLRAAGIFMDDTPALTIQELRAKCRWLKGRHGLDMVIVDDLQLIRDERKTNTGRKGFHRTPRELKALAVEFDIPVIALSSLTRSVEERRGDGEPKLCDLPGPGAIEEHADLVMFVYRDEIYDMHAEKGKAKIILAKNHNGPIGEAPVTFFAEHWTFEEYSPDV